MALKSVNIVYVTIAMVQRDVNYETNKVSVVKLAVANFVDYRIKGFSKRIVNETQVS